MPVLDAALLFFAGFLSGAVNAIAGGGTFITFGAMSLVGLPPIVANATSSLTQFPGYITSTLAYWSDIKHFWRTALLLGLISALGALAGALILLALEQSVVPRPGALAAAGGNRAVRRRAVAEAGTQAGP
ncbi:putative membrane transporter protein (modular protein) [Mesorhizobium escarrei]|uniref:Probable membrane transporter protein n=1 Tax=Mesorhizobium escarrei TaxID=666018 RepID=A0ABN8JH69_9HYPH|nr:putative membrane transporter protein (modular protein) [Mesorhizobium escarrei]